MRVFRALGGFRSTEGSFATWLTRLTRNLLIDHYRRTRNERVTDSIEEQLPRIEEGFVARNRPDAALAGREASELLQGALAKLSPMAGRLPGEDGWFQWSTPTPAKFLPLRVTTS